LITITTCYPSSFFLFSFFLIALGIQSVVGASKLQEIRRGKNQEEEEEEEEEA